MKLEEQTIHHLCGIVLVKNRFHQIDEKKLKEAKRAIVLKLNFPYKDALDRFLYVYSTGRNTLQIKVVNDNLS